MELVVIDTEAQRRGEVLVWVKRNSRARSATTCRLQDLWDYRLSYLRGTATHRAPRPRLYASVWCDRVAKRRFGHRCQVGFCPSEIEVQIPRKRNQTVWALIEEKIRQQRERQSNGSCALARATSRGDGTEFAKRLIKSLRGFAERQVMELIGVWPPTEAYKTNLQILDFKPQSCLVEHPATLKIVAGKVARLPD